MAWSGSFRCGCFVSLAGADVYMHTWSSARQNKTPQMDFPNKPLTGHKNTLKLIKNKVCRKKLKASIYSNFVDIIWPIR